MTEQIDKLRETLSKLEEELHSLKSLDPEARKLLEGAAAELQTALGKEDAKDLEPHSLIEQLTESAKQFEDSHPTLFRILGNIIDGLGQLGI